MIRVGIINSEGKIVSPQELSTAAELQQAVEQARKLIGECERLATAKTKAAGPAPTGKVPYG
jgi:hypothetical protein